MQRKLNILCIDYHVKTPPISYTYTTLKPGEIHLINLLPGKIIDPLVCGLIPTTIDTNASYKALSYTWRTFDKTASIRVGANLFPVTENLDEALRHIRHESCSQTLWMDAMCIHQENIPERTSRYA